MRILAVDYGTKRTGLAIGDDETRVALPLDVIATDDLAALAEAVADVAEREGVDRIVLGEPLHMDGTTGPMVETVRSLADTLRGRTGLTVDLFDERLTSHAAEGRFVGTPFTKRQRKRRVDALAAMILLQSYLDTSVG